MDILKIITDGLGITRDSAVIAIATIVGSVGSIAAAWAAKRAADATKASVDEIKEGRLQADRPQLFFTTEDTQDTEIAWTLGLPPKLRNSRHYQEASSPKFTATNVGNGAALEVNIGVSFWPSARFDETDEQNAREFFRKGWRITDADNVEDDSVFEEAKRYAVLVGDELYSTTGLSVGICPPEQKLTIEIELRHLMILLLMKIVDDAKGDKRNTNLIGRLMVNYKSITGEKFLEEYVFRCSANISPHRRKAGRRVGDERWDEISLPISISLKRGRFRKLTWFEKKYFRQNWAHWAIKNTDYVADTKN